MNRADVHSGERWSLAGAGGAKEFAFMPYCLNVEEVEGRWVAHVAGVPGCFAGAEGREAAIAAAPEAIAAYAAWQQRHGTSIHDRFREAAAEVALDEVHRAWNSAPDYEVNAFFAADRPPLDADEIGRVLTLLEWTRADLLAAVAGLSPGDLEHEVPGYWPIGGILNHVARAENWYLGRLGHDVGDPNAFPDVFTRLERVRQRLVEVLPVLASDERVVERQGELWSPRKLVRRAVWHERDHTDHIWQVRRALVGA